MTPRSYLYVPGDRPEKLARAAERGADALILDLEDAVAPSGKAEARRIVASWLDAREPAGYRVWVRVNAGALMTEDLRAVADAAPDGIYIPKVNVHALGEIDRIRDGIPVIGLVETAAGVLQATEIAAHPRVERLAIGEADLCAELGVEPSPDARELMPIRTQIVLASAATGISSPVGPVSTDFRDLEALRASTVALRRMGFGARAAIHPAQIEVINEVFTPSATEVDEAKQLLIEHEASGGGVSLDRDGRMVDEAVVRAARRILERAGVDRLT